jgi:hypothetical protein
LGGTSNPHQQILDCRGRILEHKMPRTFVSVHISMWNAAAQIIEISVSEYRIPGPPQHHHWDPKVRQRHSNIIERRHTRMLNFKGNVRHKIPNRSPTCRRSIRRREGTSDIGGHALARSETRDARSSAHKHLRSPRKHVEYRAHTHSSNERWGGRCRGLVNRSVE